MHWARTGQQPIALELHGLQRLVVVVPLVDVKGATLEDVVGLHPSRLLVGVLHGQGGGEATELVPPPESQLGEEPMLGCGFEPRFQVLLTEDDHLHQVEGSFTTIKVFVSQRVLVLKEDLAEEYKL